VRKQLFVWALVLCVGLGIAAIVWVFWSGGSYSHSKGDGVRSISFSPDGSMLASGGYGDGVRLWSVPSGQQLRHIQPKGLVEEVAFSPDGSTLASGVETRGGGVFIWDSLSGMVLRQLVVDFPSAEYTALAFSPDGRYLVVGGHPIPDTSIVLLEVSTGKVEATFPKCEKDGRVSVLAFSKNGAILAAGRTKGKVSILNGSSLESKVEYQLPDGVTGVVFNSSETAIVGISSASACAPRDLKRGFVPPLDGTASLIVVSLTQSKAEALPVVTGPVFSVVLSSDGRTLAYTDGGGVVFFYDLKNSEVLTPWIYEVDIGRLIQDGSGHEPRLAFSADGMRLAIGGDDHHIRIAERKGNTFVTLRK